MMTWLSAAASLVPVVLTGVVVVWLAFAAAALVSIGLQPTERWSAAGSSRSWWLVTSVLVPLGGVAYVLFVRPRLSGVSETRHRFAAGETLTIAVATAFSILTPLQIIGVIDFQSSPLLYWTGLILLPLAFTFLSRPASGTSS